MRNFVILLAAGEGIRFGDKTPKCFIKINNQYLWNYSLTTFLKIKKIEKIVLVLPKPYIKKVKVDNDKVLVTFGGRTRNQSFENGLKALKQLKPNDKIIVHDAARVGVSIKDINKILNSKELYGSLYSKSKPNNRDLRIKDLNIQTPQFCLYKTYKLCKKKNKSGKDLFTYLNLKPNKRNLILSTCPNKNLKITYKEDIDKLF